MPYRDRSDLPPALQDHLPGHAQDIYVKVFNSAWRQYADPAKRRDGESRDETAHRVAWAAVKKKYAKGPKGNWRPK